jgi:hypothetical protein
MRTDSTRNARRRLSRAAIETLEHRALLSGDGLQATYYAGPDFSGASLSRVDPAINFNWKHDSPAAGFSTNQMSVRWTGQLLAPASGKYTFYASSQGGLKLLINGQLLVNAWKNHRTQTAARTIALVGGQKYAIELDYQGGKFPALVSLSWFHRGKNQKKQIVPTQQLYSGTAAPASNLRAERISSSQIDLSWHNNSDNETGFKVQRSADGGAFVTVATASANATAFSDTTVPPGRDLSYQVIATNSSGDSAPSNSAGVAPPAPAQPVALNATGVSGNEIDLSWQDPTGYSAAYQIERSTDSGHTFSPLATVDQPATSYADTTLAPGTTYTYEVTAVNDTGQSGPTYPIIANTLSGFTTSDHPAPATLGSSGDWQYATPADEVLPDSEQPNNVFYVGQPVAFTLEPKSFTQQGNAKSYEVRDYYGNVVDSGAVAQLLYLPLKPENPGWYKLYLYGAPDNTTATFGDVVGSTTFCVFNNDPNFPLADAISVDGNTFSPADTLVDPILSFPDVAAWQNADPQVSSLVSGDFAVRWTGWITPAQSGLYTLQLSSFSRLWIDGQEVIDAWSILDPTTCQFNFVAGQSYPIRIDHYKTTADATQFSLEWRPPGLGQYAPSEVIPQSELFSSTPSPGSTGNGLSATYYSLVLGPDTSGYTDEVAHAITGIGPQRYEADASNPSATIADLTPEIDFDTQYYTPLDPQRDRQLMIAFGNGTEPYLSGVTQIVEAFENQVEYWEGLNEPNGDYSNGADFVPVMRDFYNTVKAVNPNLKVLGPAIVTVDPGTMTWLNQFFAAGGGQYIDAFSFHAYNMVNRDLTLARETLTGLKNLLDKYGLGNIPIWQTEQGYMAAVYGDYEPENQGEWEMLEQMAFEQAGIPKEQDVYFYDTSHGFWDFPTFFENNDGSLDPAAALMRVWSEELYGTNFSQAYDFGADGNNTYIGSLFSGPGKNVAVFMTGGATDGQVNLDVTGGASLRVVDAFGNVSTVPVVAGTATIGVPILPVYVELAAGQSISVIPVNWGPDLATEAGVTALASGTNVDPIDPTIPDSIDKIHDGILQNWYYDQQPNDQPWMDNTPAGQQTWVEIDLPTAPMIDHVVVRAPTPWQWDGAPLDYELQFWSNGQWVTIQHVQEDPKTFAVYSPETDTTVDSYYSERSIFIHNFTPVVTSKIRLLVNDVTAGGGATPLVAQAGGQTGPQQLTFQEIEIYGE